MARSVRTRHQRAHSRNGHRLQSYGRSQRAQSPASFAQPGVRPERQPASDVPDRSSSFREGRGAERPSRAPRHAPAVDHQNRIAAADELVSVDEKFCFQRGRIPDASSNKMMQLIIITRRKSLGHRLNALAITRADQPRYVNRAHPLPRLVTQTLQEWLEPPPKLAFPTHPRVRHGRPSIKPTTHESLKN